MSIYRTRLKRNLLTGTQLKSPALIYTVLYIVTAKLLSLSPQLLVHSMKSARDLFIGQAISHTTHYLVEGELLPLD